MKEKNIFFIRIMPGFLLLLIVVMLCICRNRENGKPLACLAMTSADDSFVASVAQELEKQLKTCGNRVLVSFSDNDMNQQINQIENYVAMHPAVLVIQCTGAVSYTHLDVYKRQEEIWTSAIFRRTRYSTRERRC